ncbi:(Fe-S)-binding protein [Desulfobacula sp.]|uniref:(Fe-S)-binding protein n=1 Tax=Desulfobacula sp. TaxID=2593537 RepID=UPI0026280002|nr:(Fe-S)-binding protein [Desulfobacula sp.]
MSLKYSLKSILHWTIKRPVMTVATLIFHAGFIVIPFFLNAHVILLKTTWGFGWPSLPESVTDALTLLVIICCFIFLIRRLVLRNINDLTGASNYWLLLLAAAPFITGFLAHHHTDNYHFWLVFHILSGEILLVTLLLSIGLFILRYLNKKFNYEKIIFHRFLIAGLMGLCLVITGFYAKGPEWAWPVGSMASLILPRSSPGLQFILNAHFFLVLAGAAVLMPSGFLRHVSASTINIVYWPKRQMGKLGTIAKGKTGFNTIASLSWKQLLDAEACVSCGKCIENCPAVIAGKPLYPEKILQKIFGQIKQGNGKNTEGLNTIISNDEIWSCTTCMACVHHCPVYTDPVDKIIDLRRHQTMCENALPKEVRPMIRNLELFGDTHGKGPAHRTDWIQDNEVAVLSRDHFQTDVLLWVGCSGAFNPRYTTVYRSMVRILIHAGVEFAVLGKKERCCGDQARRLGQETVFNSLAKNNIHEIKKYTFKKIVTLCPHCFHSLKHEYPDLGGQFDVMHASELVQSLIKENKITPRYPRKSLLTIHDPCYLGRVNKIVEPIRKISRAIDGIEIKELEHRRENGFCCGAGGGQMWLHDSIGRHINHIRAEQIVDSGADMVVTACPYCLTMLDDGINAAEPKKPVEAVDIIEMVASSIG